MPLVPDWPLPCHSCLAALEPRPEGCEACRGLAGDAKGSEGTECRLGVVGGQGACLVAAAPVSAVWLLAVGGGGGGKVLVVLLLWGPLRLVEVIEGGMLQAVVGSVSLHRKETSEHVGGW
eukprot:scaffold17238_cov20-Tisochrysis_lutea.AAC.4